MRRALIFLTSLVFVVGVAAAPASAEETISNVALPSIGGTPQFEGTLTATPGEWSPDDDLSLSYQWFRGATPVGNDSSTYDLLSPTDLGQTFTVRVTASRSGATGSATSAGTATIQPAALSNTKAPQVTGSPRFRQTLTASSGGWSRTPQTYAYRWFRDGVQISRARAKTYTLGPADVGTRIALQVTATRQGFTPAVSPMVSTTVVQHLRPVRRVVTYRVATRGRVSASVAEFKRLAAETYADPRGWRGMGVEFRQVRTGGSFTLVLSQASKMRTFSSGCSKKYSCRVGRNVIINETRWKKASPAWNKKHGSLRDYRHMVVNHETGHWFGRGHAKCGGKGKLAPLMQQQSKGLHGCKINPWPKTGELHSKRFHY